MLKVPIMYGMTTSIPLKSLMLNVMEMKQACQAVNMSYHHIHPVTIITTMVLLQYFAKRVHIY